MKTLLGCFLISLLLSGCSVRHVEVPLQNTITTPNKQELPDFVIVHPLTDDPDNPSPHNPIIKKFGDIPEVLTYIRLQRKFLFGIGLNVDEAIELYTAEAYLYPSLEAKTKLKAWKKDKERYERLGILMDKPIMRYNIKADSSDEDPANNETAD